MEFNWGNLARLCTLAKIPSQCLSQKQRVQERGEHVVTATVEVLLLLIRQSVVAASQAHHMVMLRTRQITGLATVSRRSPILVHSLHVIRTLELIIYFDVGWTAAAGFFETGRDGARVRALGARCRFGRRSFRQRIAAGVLGFWIERLVRPRINPLTDELLAQALVANQ
ncbi:hypothetical protein NL676_031517 [Syzygium grande]|nr:hypothetical protein NL676_031517 [Syzygium grande]